MKEFIKKLIKMLPLILLAGMLVANIFKYRNILFDKDVILEIFDMRFDTIISALGIIVAIIIAICGTVKDSTVMKYVGTGMFLFILLIFVIWIGRQYQPELPEEDSNTSLVSDISSFPDIPIIVDSSVHEAHNEIICSTPEPQVVVDMLEDSFAEYLQERTDSELWMHYYQDYEGNGERQMFAIVEKISDYSKSDDENGYGTLWYVDKYGVIEVDNETKEYLPEPISFIENGCVFQTFKQYRPDGNIAYVWSVSDGKPYQLAISGQGSDIRINEFKEIEVVVPEKGSGSEISVEPEEMVYYFYIDDTNTLREYGGLKISVKDFTKIPELTEISGLENIISEIYSQKYWVSTIYYRENGIFNIICCKEYGTEIKYYTITIRVDGSEWQYVLSESGKEYCEGACLETLVPSIATYPDGLPY